MAMAKDLRYTYKAAKEEEGSAALEKFSEKWDKDYHRVSVFWKKYLGEIATFLNILRRSVYGSIRQIPRRVFIGRSKKCLKIYRAPRIGKPWSSGSISMWRKQQENEQCNTGDWAMIYSLLMIIFANRFRKYV